MKNFFISPNIDFVLCFQIRYIEDIQLGFLRLLSTRAQQKFTYYCSNSIAVRNAQDNSDDLALRLMGDNEHEFKTEKLSKQEVDDGCAVSWSHDQ